MHFCTNSAINIPVLPLMLLARAAATWVDVDLALNFMIEFWYREDSCFRICVSVW